MRHRKTSGVPVDTKRVISLKEIGKHAGLSLATVSYALRHDPKISLSTRERVIAVAGKLGYRPNPRISSLMAHIRGANERSLQERLAFIWVHTTRSEARQNPFLRKVFAGAQDRAAQTGFVLEEFWTNEAQMTDQRLAQILRARGIVGVILSPVITAEATVTLAWNWQHFAPAVIGNVTWMPELHHAGHHHYLGMQMALRELAKLGRSRPVALIEEKSNERSKRAWEAAFLAHYGEPKQPHSMVRVLGLTSEQGLGEWLRKTGGDALIVSELKMLEHPGVRKVCKERGLVLVTLYWSKGTPRTIGGVDQCYDRISGHAVDLVAAQLNANETGAPDLARIMLFPGRWVAPSLPKKVRSRTSTTSRKKPLS